MVRVKKRADNVVLELYIIYLTVFKRQSEGRKRIKLTKEKELEDLTEEYLWVQGAERRALSDL